MALDSSLWDALFTRYGVFSVVVVVRFSQLIFLLILVKLAMANSMASVPPFSDGLFCCNGLLFVLVVVVVAGLFAMKTMLGQVAMLLTTTTFGKLEEGSALVTARALE